MGTSGKHVAATGSLRRTRKGKHAARGPGRPSVRVLVSVVAALWVVGCVVAIHYAGRPTTPTAGGAMAVTSEGTRATQVSVAGLERLVVYGHSMPAGGGASDTSRGYAALAAEMTGLELVNRAVGGASAAESAEIMQAAPEVTGRDALVVHVGMNNILRRGDGAAAHGRPAVRELLAGTRAAARRVVVLECQPASWQHTPRQRNLQPAFDAWNRMLSNEAARWPDVAVLDTCESWQPRENIDLPKFHPNDDGHALIAAELVATLAGP